MNGIEAYIKAMLYRDAMTLDKQLRNKVAKDKNKNSKNKTNKSL